MEVWEFDDLASVERAIAAKEQAFFEAKASGKSDKEAGACGILAYGQVRRKEAIDFCKKFEDKLNGLSNQSLAALLRALVALGLNIEDDEEFEYWYNLLESMTRRRIMEYFIDRNGVNSQGRLNRQAEDEKTILSNTKQYSVGDLIGLRGLISLMTKINLERKSKDDKRALLLKWAEKYIEKDIKLKEKNSKSFEEKAKSKPKTRPTELQKDWLAELKEKMTFSGVSPNSSYWAEVINEYDMSLDKASFAQSWQVDNFLLQKQENQKLKEQQETANNDKVNADLTNKNKEEEFLKQQQELMRQAELVRQKCQQENKLKEEKQRQEMEKQREEFKNAANRKAVKKMQEEKGRTLTKKEMAVMKIKSAAKSGR